MPPVRFYIDDSGKNDPPVFVLGGILIDADRVAAFEQDWRDALAAPPAISFFKMKDAKAGKGEFKGLKPLDRDNKVASLGAVLAKHVRATIAVVVRHEDYERIYSGRMAHWLDRPYQMMFHLTIATGYKLCRQLGIESKAAFIFDRQLDDERSLRESYASFEDAIDSELAAFLAVPPRHADDKDEVALQAADMVAWHIRRSWHDGITALSNASGAGPRIAGLPGKHDLIGEDMLHFLANVAKRTARRLGTLLPHEAEQFTEQFDRQATIANLHLMANALPFQPVELISFPAIGTRGYRLVRNCAALHTPHLHRGPENRCLGAETSA
jgi:hypothetical protein